MPEQPNLELLALRSDIRFARSLAAEMGAVSSDIRGQANDLEQRWADYAEALGSGDQEAIGRAYNAGRERAYHLQASIARALDVGAKLQAEWAAERGERLRDIVGDFVPTPPPAPPPPPRIVDNE